MGFGGNRRDSSQKGPIKMNRQTWVAYSQITEYTRTTMTNAAHNLMTYSETAAKVYTSINDSIDQYSL